MKDRIGFNKPYFTGKETEYIRQAVESGKISGDGAFTRKCHRFFQERYGFKKNLLTTSCTDALEMCGLLLDIKPGDEVICPSFSFVSTANAFVLRGAEIRFADSEISTPNIDAGRIEELITSRTKAIVVVHYAGIACDMDAIDSLARRHNLFLIEDAAQAIDSYYKGRALGSIGHLGAISFHESKNIISGEGGLLILNDDNFFPRAEIFWEKGTNRAAFFRGEVDKYTWLDIGSSFLPSDIIAAVLYAQLENLDRIQRRRKEIWNDYYRGLKELEERGLIRLPFIPGYATNNAHMFFVLCANLQIRTQLSEYLKKRNIDTVFHYSSLHKSPFCGEKYRDVELKNSDRYSDCLLRFPLFYEMSSDQVSTVIDSIYSFYNVKRT
jgi:dTDP-4-amino-4,6-dideoxygalactose transaminase